MAPLVILVATALAARLAGLLGIASLAGWRSSTRLGLVVLFVFTGVTHFTSMRHDYAAMIPPPLTGQLGVVYITGLLEVAGAAGLLPHRTRRLAGACLCLLLVVLLPANIHAALNGIPFRGAPPAGIVVRSAIQAFLLAAVLWSCVIAAGGESDLGQDRERA